MKKIYLRHDFLFKEAEKRKESLEKFIVAMEKDLSNAPTGLLRIIKNKNSIQYYHIKSKNDRNGKYIAKSNFQLAQDIAQRDYNKKAIEIAKKQLTSIEKFLNKYPAEGFKNLYYSLKENRREIIEPCYIPNEKWITRWQNTNFERKSFAEVTPDFSTSKGLRVRSKSEIIISEALYKADIPFRYEFPITMNSYTIYPDFYCLNPITGEEILWEHFGLMDDTEYTKIMVKKISNYQNKGYFPGKNLIITFENAETPLTAKKVQEIIKVYFQ